MKRQLMRAITKGCTKQLILTASVLLWGTTAFSEIRLSPRWMQPISEMCPNSSFLEQWTNKPSSTLAEEVLRKDVVFGMRQEYQDLVRAYEQRSQYGLVEPTEERVHRDRLSRFMGTVAKRIQNQHLKENRRRLRSAVERQPMVEVIRRPVELVSVAAAAYSGKPIKFSLNSNINVAAFADVPEQKGQVKFSGQWLNGQMDFLGRAPDLRNPYEPAPVDPLQRQEKFQLSLSRPLSLWDLHGGLTYGSTTTTVTTTVSRQIVENLKCVVDASKPLGYSDAERGFADSSVKFFYEIRL